MSINLNDAINHPNIAELLDEDKLKEIGMRVCEDFDTDEESRKEYLDAYDEWMRMARQVWEDKTYPWRNASNMKFPLVTMGAVQFHARAYPALMPSHNLVSAKIVGKDETGEKQLKAERIQNHLEYQLLCEMDDWEGGFDKLLITLPITGCEFAKTYYDTLEGVNISEYIPATDVAINYHAKSVNKAARITHIMEYSRNEIIERERAGIWLEGKLDIMPRDDVATRLREDADGREKPAQIDDDSPTTILEQHRFLDLDDDGYAEPYIVTIEQSTKKVKRIVARFNENSITYNAYNEVTKIEADQYFTKYEFVPNPDGSIYGIGFGALLGPLNSTVDTIINQLIDAGHLTILQSGFISKNFRIKGGDLNFEPGEWKQINASTNDIKGGVVPLPTKEPSAVLFNMLSMLINIGERLTSTTDMMVGENPGQNQKATTTMAVLDQGMKVFTAIYKRIRKSLGEEFKKLHKINKTIGADTASPYLLPGDYEDSDEDGSVDIVPSADPNMATEAQRQRKATMLIELKQTGVLNPMSEQDMEISMRILDSLEIPSPEKVLAPIPEQMQPSPEMLKVQLEMEKEVNAEREREFRRQLDLAKEASDNEDKDDKNALKEEEIKVKALQAAAKIVSDAQQNSIKAREVAKKDVEKANKAE